MYNDSLSTVPEYWYLKKERDWKNSGISYPEKGGGGGGTILDCHFASTENMYSNTLNCLNVTKLIHILNIFFCIFLVQIISNEVLEGSLMFPEVIPVCYIILFTIWKKLAKSCELLDSQYKYWKESWAEQGHTGVLL